VRTSRDDGDGESRRRYVYGVGERMEGRHIHDPGEELLGLVEESNDSLRFCSDRIHRT
jgi:hypothetical protein